MKHFLTLLCLVCAPAFAGQTNLWIGQPLSIGMPLTLTAASGGGTCTLLGESTLYDDSYGSLEGSDYSQTIKITGSTTICSARFRFTPGSGSGTAHFELWSDDAKAGTKYGGNSATFSITADGNVWSDWASPVTVTTDCYLHVVVESGTGITLAVSSTGNYTAGYYLHRYDVGSLSPYVAMFGIKSMQ